VVINDLLVNGKLPLQQNAAMLGGDISIVPGSPRAFYVGMKMNS
jgi:hypothetical protein